MLYLCCILLITYSFYFISVIKARHNNYDPYRQTHPINLDASGITDGKLDEKYVLSVRVRTGRAIRGLPHPPVCSRAERREVEKLCKEAFAHLPCELKGIILS